MINQISIAIVSFVSLAFAGIVHYFRMGKRKNEHHFDVWAK